MIRSHSNTTRVAAICALFTVALLLVPRADVPETRFDEANTPTNEMMVEAVVSSQECRQPIPSLVPKILVLPQRIALRVILPVHKDRSTGHHALQELLCTLLC